MSLAILASGSYCETMGDESLSDLKAMVKESTGVAVRRVTRFVQLALIGAGRCAQQVKLPADTAVYFSSCRGDIAVTVELLNDMIRREEMPGPLTFVNSVSNAACFHVASTLGLHGQSNFITNRFDPLVAALKSAWLDLACGEVQTALVGSVDAGSLPLSHHRQRVQVGQEQAVGEASHWLIISADEQRQKPLARITALKNFCDWTELEQWLQSRDLAHAALAPGQHLTESAAASICAASGLVERLLYRENLPHYDSQTGAAIEQFIASSLPAMLHVNSDPSERYSVLLVERP